MKALLIVIAIVGVLLGFGYAMMEDANEAQRSRDRYTKMVCEGSWPDYDMIEPDCE